MQWLDLIFLFDYSKLIRFSALSLIIYFFYYLSGKLGLIDWNFSSNYLVNFDYGLLEWYLLDVVVV